MTPVNDMPKSDDDFEKPEYISNGDKDPGRERNQAIIDSWNTRDVKKVMWRVDLRLVLMLGLLYGVSLMDRTNLPNASIAG